MDWKNTVQAALSGNSEAWSLLFEKTQSMVYFTCVKLLHNVDAAEDISQDVYMSAMQSLHTLSDAEAFPGWIKRIAVNLSKNYLAKKRPMLFSEDEQEASFGEIAEVREDFLPEEYAQRRETCRIVTGIIDKLPEKQRMCVILYYYDELSVAEIAEIMDVSENTIKSRLNYARSAIKKEVEALEKKGTKLYCAGLPVLALILRNASSDYVLSAKAAAAITAGFSAAGTTAAAATGATSGAAITSTATTATTSATTAVTTAAATTAAASTVATAATTAAAIGAPILVKIIAGIVAATVVVSGIAIGINKISNADDDDYRGGKHNYTEDEWPSGSKSEEETAQINKEVRESFANRFPYLSEGGGAGYKYFYTDITHDDIDELFVVWIDSPDGEYWVHSAEGDGNESFFNDYSQEMSNWRYVHYLVFIDGKAHIMRSGWFGRQGYPLHFYEIFYINSSGEKIIVAEERYENEEALKKEVETNKKIEEYHKNGFIILGFPDGDIGFGTWTQEQLDALVKNNK